MHIIKAMLCISSLAKALDTRQGVMRYNSGNAAVDDMHAVRDDMPPASQVDKKSHSLSRMGFLARPAGFEPAAYRFVAGHSIH